MNLMVTFSSIRLVLLKKQHSGGNDKLGFPMKQGVLCNHRVRLFLSEGYSCYRARCVVYIDIVC